MSIKAVAEHTGMHWETVKNIEKEWLKKKYRRVSLGNVEYLGIDEVYLGKTPGFITVVRDLDSGNVLFIGKGKSGEALKPFENRVFLSEARSPFVCGCSVKIAGQILAHPSAYDG